MKNKGEGKHTQQLKARIAEEFAKSIFESIGCQVLPPDIHFSAYDMSVTHPSISNPVRIQVKYVSRCKINSIGEPVSFVRLEREVAYWQ